MFPGPQTAFPSVASVPVSVAPSVVSLEPLPLGRSPCFPLSVKTPESGPEHRPRAPLLPRGQQRGLGTMNGHSGLSASLQDGMCHLRLGTRGGSGDPGTGHTGDLVHWARWQSPGGQPFRLGTAYSPKEKHGPDAAARLPPPTFCFYKHLGLVPRSH